MEKPDFSGWSCPPPLQNYPNIIMGHGSGGKLSSDLIQHLFLPLFENAELMQLGDSAVVDIKPMDGHRLAFSTDSFVVSPLFFPNSNIGELAINGTVNDLAMCGASPTFISAAFILEEGLPIKTLAEIAHSMANACQAVGVKLVTGDTKVVGKGHGDGVYINTTGLGLVPPEVNIAPQLARPGDAVIVSGTIGDHGMAIMSVREGLEFETEIVSDTASMNRLVGSMLSASKEIHCLRDATRGGLASTLNELASASKVGIEIEEAKFPITPAVLAACEILGFDPLYVANEGKLLAILPQENAAGVLRAMQKDPLGKDAVQIGTVVADHPGVVIANTSIGGRRVVDLPAGELLPRIC